MHSQSSSTRDCVQIPLAFSNQFYIIDHVDGTTISSLAPNSTCPRWLGMPRRKVYARHSRGRRPTRYQTSTSEPVHPTFLRQRKGKILHKHLRCRRIRISFTSRLHHRHRCKSCLTRRVMTFLAFLTFVLVRCRSTFGSGRWSIGVISPVATRPSLSLPTTIRTSTPRHVCLFPS